MGWQTAGDGGADYRTPPMWDYENTAGYRHFDDLFPYHDDRLMQFLDGDRDCEVPVLNYNTPSAP